MSSAAPWSVKGIDPKAREIAKDLARRSGMTLGEWLNQVILDDGGIEPVEEPLPPRQTFPGSAFAGPAYAAPHAHRPIGETPAPPRSTFGAASAYRRIETPEHPGDELYRITEALERLTSRIEAAEHRSTLAISGIEQSVAGVVTRLSSSEREQTAVAARFEGAVDDLRVEQARLAERLRRTEQEAAGARSTEALRAMEGALAKVAGRLYEDEARTRESLAELRGEIDRVAEAQPAAGAEIIDQVVARVGERLTEAEAKTREAMRGLEASFASLDHRLGAAEVRIGARGSDAGLEQLAASLSARVDAARAEMAEKMGATADGRFERMERSIQEMTGHVQAAERRSAEAIERMGHEVLRMADTLNRKVESAEARSTAAFQQVGGEMARIANVVEGRLTRTDDASAQALEKLGAEIARITERLSERIAAAERRSAQAIDDVSNNVGRISDRMQDRQERVSSELADRIRQSEERTARLLEDARERIDARLAEGQRRTAEPRADHGAYAPPPYPDPAYPAQTFTDVSFSTPAFSDPTVADADIAPFGERSFDLPPPPAASPMRYVAPEDLAPPPVFAPSRPVAEADPFERESLFGAPIPRASGLDPTPAEAQTAEPALAAERDAEHDPLEAALAASSAARRGQMGADGFLDEGFGTDAFVEGDGEAEAAMFAPVQSTKAVIEQARAAARASSEAAGGRGKGKGGGLFGGFGQPKAKPREGSTLRTAFLMSGTAAAVGVALAGYEILAEKPTGALPRRVAEALDGGRASSAAPAKPLSIEVGEPMAAVAIDPKPIGSASAIPPPAAPAPAPAKFTAPSPDATADYATGARRIEAHDNGGVDDLRKSANLGYAPAQFYLAKLYENGGAGLKKDMDEARRWTERAAQGGDKKAMHNLALYYFEGTGGPKNTTTAAQWFHRAADLGLVDSQYNLGRLYEEGFGVAQNPAEAYKWYLIAARQGDAESRSSAQRLKHQLSPEAQATAERAAAAFVAPGASAPASEAVVPAGQSANIAAQKALSRLGYYKGPTDGAASPALKLAIAAYQRDQGLQPTGQMDTALAQLFTAVAQ
jgi:localization factor PodJL